MRILLVHSHYGAAAPSGENLVFALERDMLIRNGHEVKTYERFSDELRTKGTFGKLKGAMMTPWNRNAAREIAALIHQFRPEIVHAHNTFPMLSPAIFPAARGAARVLTLHNYRLQCAAAIPMRDGQPCTECIDLQSVCPALAHGCYRDSRVATAPLALSIALHNARGTWQRDIERFIALSDFQKELMARGGLPIDRIEVKPNFYPGRPKRIPFTDRPERIVFVGRISPEKGVKDLVDAWRLWGPNAPELRIVGDGPLSKMLQRDAADLPQVKFIGQVSNATAEAEIASSRLLVAPSRWFEGFPMVLREAFAYGVATAVSEIGPLPTIVSNARGAVFPAGAPEELSRCLQALWQDQRKVEGMAIASAKAFETRYAESKNYDELMAIYSRAIVGVASNRN
jgi:glycosyltransferase involved in cell wall biosynthesis